MGWAGIRRGYRRFIPIFGWKSNPQMERTLERLPGDALVCDVGAGGRKTTPTTVTIDKYVATNTSVCSDVHEIALASNTFDCVLCTSLLEHVKRPEAVLEEIRRVLKPGGTIHVEVPFLQTFHPDPVDYYRWTQAGLALVCKRHGFAETDSGATIGPFSSLSWALDRLIHSLVGNSVPARVGQPPLCAHRRAEGSVSKIWSTKRQAYRSNQTNDRAENVDCAVAGGIEGKRSDLRRLGLLRRARRDIRGNYIRLVELPRRETHTEVSMAIVGSHRNGPGRRHVLALRNQLGRARQAGSVLCRRRHPVHRKRGLAKLR